MSKLKVFALLLFSFCAWTSGQSVEEIYQQAYGQFQFYRPDNIPFTKYYFCAYHSYNCQKGFNDFCLSFDTTCDNPTTSSFGSSGYFSVLARVYCRSWCDRCRDRSETECKSAAKKCEYTKYIENFPRVFNGVAASSCTNPWVVALRPNVVVDEEVPPRCQGVLIDSGTVVTTKECLDILNQVGNNVTYNATFGDYIWSTEELNETTVTATLHTNNDLNGVVTLSLNSPLDFNQCVAPACLSSLNSAIQVDHTKCQVTGWGSSSSGGLASPTLQKGSVIIADKPECTYLLDLLPALDINLEYGNNNLVGCTSLRDSPSSSCSGDEGGAVTCEDKYTGEQILVGLIKFGGCQRFNATVFVNVTTIL